MRWNEPGLTVGSRVRAIRDCDCPGHYVKGELGTVETTPYDGYSSLWVRFDNHGRWEKQSWNGLYAPNLQNLELFRGEVEMLFT